MERLPFERCPKCGEAFPADFARDLEARFTPRRPLLLNLQLFLGWIFGVLGLLTLPFAFETQDFSQLEALGVRIPSIPGLPMGLATLAQVLLLLWSTWAIQRQQARARPLLMWLIASMALPLPAMLAWAWVGGPAAILFWMFAATEALALLLAWWALYRSKTFVTYFGTLKSLESRRS